MNFFHLFFGREKSCKKKISQKIFFSFVQSNISKMNISCSKSRNFKYFEKVQILRFGWKSLSPKKKSLVGLLKITNFQRILIFKIRKLFSSLSETLSRVFLFFQEKNCRNQEVFFFKIHINYSILIKIVNLIIQMEKKVTLSFSNILSIQIILNNRNLLFQFLFNIWFRTLIFRVLRWSISFPKR